MNKPKVTAVIPVYNTEAYVEQAVRSVLEQTLREIEIVVVNDGSTDRSLAVVERLAAEDDRIVIFSQPNKGLSEARNAGIDRAHGEFIHFMDSDDLLEPDAYELCYRRAADEHLDFVFFDAESFGAAESGADWLDYRRVAAVGEEVRPGAAQLTRMLDTRHYRASACLSFIRTEYLRARQLRFYPRIIHEDELFTPQLYLGAARTAGIPRAFFRRRVREGSIMGTRFSQRSLDGYLTVLAELGRYADARKAEEGQSDKPPHTDRTRNGQARTEADRCGKEMRRAEETPQSDRTRNGQAMTEADRCGKEMRYAEETPQSDRTRTAEESCGAEQTRRIVDRLTGYILRPVTYHAASLPANSRLRLAVLLLRRYARHVTPRQFALLLLRAPLKKVKGVFGHRA